MEFNLTFAEAMEHLFLHGDRGWVQGEQFSKETYLTCDGVGVIRQCQIDDTFSWSKEQHNVLLTKGLMNQKYRIIQVLNYSNVVGLR